MPPALPCSGYELGIPVDRDRSFWFIMNDFLTKPIELDPFNAALVKWLASITC